VKLILALYIPTTTREKIAAFNAKQNKARADAVDASRVKAEPGRDVGMSTG
jgi:hypothetical protein